jgi:hypothetical protein
VITLEEAQATKAIAHYEGFVDKLTELDRCCKSNFIAMNKIAKETVVAFYKHDPIPTTCTR